MHPSLARHLKRYQAALIAAASRSLVPALGEDRARSEAASMIAALQHVSARGGPTEFLEVLHSMVERWQAAGVASADVSAALLSLLRSKMLNAARGGRDWAVDLAPLFESLPTPMAFIDEKQVIRLANSGFRELASETSESLLEVPFTDLLIRVVGDDPAAPGAIRRERRSLMRLDRVRLRGRPEREMLITPVPFEPAGVRVGWFVALANDVQQALAEASLAELLKREKRQNERFAALLTVSNALSNTLDLDEIVTTIARNVRQVIQTDECTVFLFDEKEQVLVPFVCDAQEYVTELMGVRLKLGEGITGMVALNRRGEIVHDAESDPRALSIPGTPPEQTALLCVPLLTHERVVGVITLSRVGGRRFQQEDLELATLFASQCSAAITNARLYEDQKAAYEQLRAAQAQLVQSAKLNALGEMAGGVAHDFNNILAAILGRTQLLMQHAPDPEVNRQLQVIEQAALDGAQTVRRVQEFTRVRQDERFETLDVNQVLLSVIELTRPAWESGTKRRGVAIDVHLELRATQSTPGNGSELREVFTNLVLNAVDAMPEGGDLWVTTENGPGVVRVEVRDTGIGMDEDTAGKIFDPFFTTKELKGTGLGLSVAYGIVTRHRGTIFVASKPGHGTQFTLAFPVGAVASPTNPSLMTGPLPNLRVLVVDDEEAVLEVMADLLRVMGMRVTTAKGGPEGVEALQNGVFDVVFTDLGMPELNGWDLALTVKSKHPQTAVVLVTGWGFQLEEETATARGVDRVMAKPFSWDEVEQALRYVIERMEPRRVA